MNREKLYRLGLTLSILGAGSIALTAILAKPGSLSLIYGLGLGLTLASFGIAFLALSIIMNRFLILMVPDQVITYVVLVSVLIMAAALVVLGFLTGQDWLKLAYFIIGLITGSGTTLILSRVLR
jgi:hypothetical protein